MKCICGYEYDHSLGKKTGDLKFKKIVVKSDKLGGLLTEDILYACPKCGTLKIKIR